MSRTWIIGAVAITAVAALKTFIIIQFLMPDTAVSFATVSGLFALFFALTAAVAYVSFTQLRALMERQRKEKLAPGAGEPVAKETVILRNATTWGLSQAEADVAIFVVKGFSNGEIAEMRGCAIATVKTQLGRIYQKSGLASRYQLIAFVTDEVCSMANEHEEEPAQVVTRNVLPLSGRTKSAAPQNQTHLA
ncbi:helix-turn-helix transcriptional regulator [Sulfitobacter guttiformis]|uniref:Regulatory LuxR family protein n=1 Tax=Sulfitobacter guttiformis TaxID=74349 RepID=A0A420DK61_9RHOB|nr:helix-turn-helix transcriptional regulator [Sulfitobacter guttiformis]KIN71546.1 Transcriptional regulator, LuxR family protein [Sulfitobacter guttiformis KCTC 32187]RKE94617.1 regulatory LuxR family protein [Sulfitobacter guttiformis]